MVLKHFYQVAITLALLMAILVIQPAATLAAPHPALRTAPRVDDFRIYLPTIGYQARNCRSLVSPNVFGIQLYGNTGRSNNPYFLYYQDLGAAWVRAPIYWSSVEPTNTTPANYNWSSADRVAGAAADACLNMVVTHLGAPDWAATAPDGPIDKVPLSELVEYITALVERYDGDGIDDAPRSPVVNYWEFYNEPDEAANPNGGRWGHDGDAYAAMLAAVYPAVKAANPNAKVVFGGIAYDWFDTQNPPGPFVQRFLDDVLSAGGGAHFDIMNFHAYPSFAGTWTQNNGPGLREKAEAIRTKLQEYNLNKPIVITETGWHSDNDPVAYGSPEIQARYVLMLYTQSLAAHIDFSIWFSMIDPGPLYPFENGLISDDNPPIVKPAYTAYQVAATKLRGVTFQSKLTDAETGSYLVEVYRFTTPQGKTLYIGWRNPVTSNDTHAVRLPAEAVTVQDLYGTVVATIQDHDDGQNDGQVTVSLSAAPVYIDVLN